MDTLPKGYRLMELAQLLITPGTLLTAFIFFWKQAKTGRDELKWEIKEDLNQIRASSDELRREIKADMRELKEELKSDMRELKKDMTSVRREVTSIKEEIHNMNGRLGRVESLVMTSEVIRPRPK